MKRIIIALLTAMMATSLFACGSNDALVKENEELKLQIEELNAQLAAYEEYDDLIKAIEDGNTVQIGSLISQMITQQPVIKPGDTGEIDSFVGTWASAYDQNVTFTLNEDGTGFIGEKECTWKTDGNAYGLTGLTLYVDNGAGFYQFLIYGSSLRGNGNTANIPDYFPPEAFGGQFFTKTE